MTPDGTSLDRDVRELLAQAVDALHDQGVDPASTYPLTHALDRPVGADDVRWLRRDTAAVAARLKTVEEHVRALERAAEEQDPFGEVGWGVRIRALRGETDPSRYRGRWVGLWVEALTVDRWDRADEAADLAQDTGTDRLMRKAMCTVSRAFATESRADALPALETLTAHAAYLDDTVAVVTLTVLRARIHLRDTGDTTAAKLTAREAVDRADTPGRAAADAWVLAMATLAEVHLRRGRADEAGDVLDGTRHLATTCPDALVVAGLLAEHREARGKIDDLYDAAVDRVGIDAARPFVLRPTPPNLLWRAARSIRSSDPETALALIETALAGRIAGEGAYPDRRARVDHGRILRTLHRPARAATAFAAAADRYAWSGLTTRATSLYEQAHELAPDDPDVASRLAETLRVQSEDEDSVVDRSLAGRAVELVPEFPAGSASSQVRARVLTTRAMLEHGLDSPGSDPLLLLERAVLLAERAPSPVDEGAGRTHAALASMLRLRGHPADAVAPARLGRQRDRRDPVAAEALASALADADEIDEALDVVRTFVGPARGSPLPVRAGLLHLWGGDPAAALAAVSAERGSDTVRLIRGNAHDLTGDRAAATAEYERVWSGGGKRRRDLARAGMRLGLVDDALRLLTELDAAGPRDRGYMLDLGLLRVRRGEGATGRRALREAVAECTIVADLVHLISVDVPLLRAEPIGDSEAADVLDEVVILAGRRCAELRTSARPEGAAALAARARAARFEGRDDEATRLYTELVTDGVLPEAGPVAGELLAGQALTLMGAGDAAAASELLDRVGRLTDRSGALRAAADRSDVDPATAGRLRDCVMDLVADPRFAELGAVLDDVSAMLTGRAHRAARTDVPDTAVFPGVTPVEIVLPPELTGLEHDPALRAGVSDLRRTVAAESGVRIPGVRVQVAGDTTDTAVSLRIYDQTVHRVTPTAERPADLGLVLDALGVAARKNLYRLLAPDDIVLWFDGWAVGTADPAPRRPVDRPSRLRLVRVLRLLLREGVPVTDRDGIMSGFNRAECAGSRGPLDTLRTVRQQLPSDALGLRLRSVRAALPHALEERVRAGLKAGGAEWTVDRRIAHGVVVDLRSWRDGLDGSVVVTVRDAVARPFVWRLLAAGGVRVPVLADEEIR